ncbi:MAG: translesion error-prone DNA polymerase V autoproteolytic subunit [Bacteroidales bacterium]|nr:translesion error-prone DNA polymerase V autoproteolytic subunit [Bacteroidales bacterium]
MQNNNQIDLHAADLTTEMQIGLAGAGIHAGFPSPAQDYIENGIDLNRELVKHPSSTFYGRVVGDSMTDAGIDSGDILVIDKALEPRDGDMAVCFVDGEFALKFIRYKGKRLFLCAANDNYADIEVLPETQFMVWGVVTYTIKKRCKHL